MEGVLKLSLDQILVDLKDGDPEIKRMATKALVQQGPRPQEMFVSILEQADRPTIMVIYDVLFDAPGDFSTVFQRGSEDHDPHVRCLAIRYLFRNGSFKRHDGIRWLKDGDPYVRRRVISYLSWINDRASLKPIITLAIEDPDPKVRRDALRLVGVWGRTQDAGKIIAVLEDKDSEVRTQAIQTLKKITGEDFGEPVGASENELAWIIARWQGWWEITKEGI